jgi:hypothetical protein
LRWLDPAIPRILRAVRAIDESTNWPLGRHAGRQRRQADVGVDCGTLDDMSMDADNPTLEYIVLVDPGYPQLCVFGGFLLLDIVICYGCGARI